ncbi:MAG: putative toxin-antitoxin system toxin component, PIN family [Elainellaceae cyanobacterium]
MQYIAVFDTNVLISALLSTTSNPFRCLALARIEQIESVTCQEILNEFSEKLIIKFKFSQEKAQAAIERGTQLFSVSQNIYRIKSGIC